MVTATPITDLLAASVLTAARDGYVSLNIPIEAASDSARMLGWTEVANRRHQRDVVDLKPVTAIAARPNSLSAKFGVGDQPLHTDGAHLAEPPDIVMLSARALSLTPTLLYPIGPARRAINDPLRAGLFLVRAGQRRNFLTAVADRSGRLRFDPGCMTPLDARAKTVARYFAAAHGRSYAHQWSGDNSVLLIDNRHTLHARGPILDSTASRVMRRIAWKI